MEGRSRNNEDAEQCGKKLGTWFSLTELRTVSLAIPIYIETIYFGIFRTKNPRTDSADI
ncbi:MAG: hypothetical protein ACM34O_07120 [Ignavibacteria bacterium]